MSFLNVPKFTLKNRHSTVIINGSLVPYYDVLNQECWRHLYNNTTDISNVPLQDSSDFKKQLPWMTLYKTHTDLLQIKLVTTIGYQEKTAGSGEYEAMFMIFLEIYPPIHPSTRRFWVILMTKIEKIY